MGASADARHLDGDGLITLKVTVKMPRVADSTDDVVIVAVLRQPGDEVAAGDDLVEVETDKVTVTVPSPVSGRLESYLVAIDDELTTGDPFAVIVAKGAS